MYKFKVQSFKDNILRVGFTGNQIEQDMDDLQRLLSIYFGHNERLMPVNLLIMDVDDDGRIHHGIHRKLAEINVDQRVGKIALCQSGAQDAWQSHTYHLMSMHDQKIRLFDYISEALVWLKH